MKKHVIITGAAGGLGRALSVECAGRGFDLFLTDVNKQGLNALKSGIENMYGVTVHTYPCDITDKDEIEKMFDYAIDINFSFDMLLNVAGLGYEGEFETRDYKSISDILKVNIESVVCMTYVSLQKRDKDRPFNIVFVSSMAAMQPIPLKATYAASKKFILNFSLAIREELKSQNVKITTICPGGLATTPEAIAGIQTQGFFGNATTNSLEVVARRTVKHALNGKMMYVPGSMNKFLSFLAKFIPLRKTTKMLYKRWTKAQDKWLDK